RREVASGFGRGSEELGVPSTNFSEKVVKNFPSDISTGIYYGWVCVGNGDLHKMVFIGWNPFYKNIKQSVVRILLCTLFHLLLCVQNSAFKYCFSYFSFVEAFISAIQEDAEEGKRQLDLPEHLQLKDDEFFHLPEGKTINH
ncbi:RIFK kinase, partial [Lophotis ruficrista]|nr:RIFK kinase [Lophotis ruficrista]